ncbi:MAG: hypothetical protein F6J98_30180 [Moorea sp. SIO4G2]|nr:hypothetical protein [Moorena bouillonii]NEO64449.1 hypothetical protein [Moorena sp. SIO4G2]
MGIALVNSGRIGGWFQGMPTLQKLQKRSRSGSKGASHYKMHPGWWALLR